LQIAETRAMNTPPHAYHVRRVPIVNGYDTTLGIATLDGLVAQLGDEMSEIGRTVSDERLSAMVWEWFAADCRRTTMCRIAVYANQSGDRRKGADNDRARS
jgi:hypothetical protein